jgi:hypothetical protein
MRKYVYLICRNCNKALVYDEQFYNNHSRKITCTCGNGSSETKAWAKQLKEQFKKAGLEYFQNNNLFNDYAKDYKQSKNKGFEKVILEGGE